MEQPFKGHKFDTSGYVTLSEQSHRKCPDYITKIIKSAIAEYQCQFEDAANQLERNGAKLVLAVLETLIDKIEQAESDIIDAKLALAKGDFLGVEESEKRLADIIKQEQV